MISKYGDCVFGKDNRAYLMGVATIWIVLFHIWMWNNTSGIVESPWWISLFRRGYVGVDIFIFLSVYGLQASIERNTLGRYYLNRLKRLFPLYFFFLLTLFATFEHSCPFDRMLIQSLYQITGLSLFQYPQFFSCGFCFDWFTPAIIVIYIVFPLASRILRYIHQKGLVLEIISLVILALVGDWLYYRWHMPVRGLTFRMPLMMLGVLTYWYIKENNARNILTLYTVSVVIGYLCDNKMHMQTMFLPALLLVYSLTSFRLPFEKFLKFVGRYSFEVYVAHIFVVAFFIPMKLVASVPLLIVITIVVSTLLATFYASLHKLFYKLFD